VTPARERVAAARRVVVKVGTNVVMRDDGAIALGRVYGLVESVAGLRAAGKEVLIVSSGAVGLGAQRLGLAERPKVLSMKQACAAIGQSRLMAVYEAGFERLGVVTAQVLLTEDDFSHRDRYLNLRGTLNKLLSLGAVPILNENDTVSTAELVAAAGGPSVFGDNDRLSALVASKVEADLLVILSDVDGLYTGNPRTDASARLIPLVPSITPEMEEGAGGSGSRGRGGMKTKLEAARIATAAGALALIASGREPGVLDRLFAGEEIGTLFLPGRALAGKKRWIAYASLPAGTLTVNAGARAALVERNASLLPAGVVALLGEFEKGDVVRLVDEAGHELARGIVNYAAADARRLVGSPPERGSRGVPELVTRDNIVLT